MCRNLGTLKTNVVDIKLKNVKIEPAPTSRENTESRTEILSLNTKKHHKNNKMSKINNFDFFSRKAMNMSWVRSDEFEIIAKFSSGPAVLESGKKSTDGETPPQEKHKCRIIKFRGIITLLVHDQAKRVEQVREMQKSAPSYLCNK